jgi:hypothetical protein
VCQRKLQKSTRDLRAVHMVLERTPTYKKDIAILVERQVRMQRAARIAAAGAAAYAATFYAFHNGYLRDVQLSKMARGVATDVLHSPVYEVWEVMPLAFAPVGGKGAMHVLYKETHVCGTAVSFRDRVGAFSLWISDGSHYSPKGVASFKNLAVLLGEGEEEERVESALYDRMMTTVKDAGVTTLYGTSHTPQLSSRMAKMGFKVVEKDYDGASSNGVELDVARYYATA